MSIERAPLMRTAIVSAVLCVAAASAQAHEFWIEPSSYTPKAGEEVRVAVRVGMHFDGQPVPRKNDRIERFAAISWPSDATNPTERLIDGDEGDDPAGRFAPADRGLAIIVYDSNHSRIELSGEDFTAYLEEKGLTGIREARARTGITDEPAREIYSRCAKSLVWVGGRDDAAMSAGKLKDAAAGLPLEIIAEFDPYASDPPDEIRVRVLFRGEPVERAYVSAASRLAPKDAQHARTDGDGRVTFRITDAGPWLVDCTHMIAAPNDANADYESFWASLTFAVAHAGDTP